MPSGKYRTVPVITPGEYDLEPAVPSTCRSPLMSTIVPNVTMNHARLGFVIASMVPRTNTVPQWCSRR